MSEPSFWWQTGAQAGQRRFLTIRAALAKALRGFFDAQGFIEADTAILQVSPRNETHISALATQLIGPDEPYAWRQWQHVWADAPPGEHTLMACAADDRGSRQRLQAEWNVLGYGNNGVREHAVAITIA